MPRGTTIGTVGTMIAGTTTALRPPARCAHVDVTGRRIVATAIDGLLFGGTYGAMAAPE